MADVVLGRAGDEVLVDLDVCAKTGRPTRDRVVLRGTTAPAWVVLLLVLTVVGYLLARWMTSSRFRITLPFDHQAHQRWVRRRRLAWAVGAAGGVLLVAGVATETGSLTLLGLAVALAAFIGGVANGVRNGVAVSVDKRGELFVSWVHPRFVAAVGAAATEAVPQTA